MLQSESIPLKSKGTQKSLATQLMQISKRSKDCPKAKFKWLMPLFNKANLIECFHGLRKDGAAGIDKLSKEDYGNNLEANIDDLIARMKKFQYRPLPVKEVLIPKSDGGVRPLGISVVEDKIVQSMFEKVLTAIFEPTFKDCSFGFRPERNCHMAIKEVHKYLYDAKTPVIIDVDLANYFGSIDHKLLLEFVSERIEDASFLRYLVRMLRCGIQVGGVVKPTRVGTPQGAICSPVLANIFAHHVMDKWIEDMVAPLFPGTRLVRYADDCIICCPTQRIADSIMAVLDQRLAKFGLSLNAKKTKVVAMNKSLKLTRRDRSGQSFNFLGFVRHSAKVFTKKVDENRRLAERGFR